MNPLISVIVPIYKVESLLPGCIDSILAQTYENLEVILELYAPLIEKYSYHQGKYDEDLHQYLLIHIALNISKFPL